MAEAGADTAQEPEPYVIGEDTSLTEVKQRNITGLVQRVIRCRIL